MYRFVRGILAPLVRVLWRVQVEGSGPLPSGQVVVVANHESLLDPLFLSAAIDRSLRYLTKDELFVGPLGRVLHRLGAIRVARGRGDREAVSAATRALEVGDAVVVFPQGTILGGGHRSWHRGAARLALATGAPIVPVRLVATARALRPGTWRVRFPRVRVIVGDAIPVERGPATIASAKELTERVREAIEGSAALPRGESSARRHS